MDGAVVGLDTLARAWYAFFFASESPVVVCVFRIALATLLLIDWLFTAPEVQHWFGPRGVFPIEEYRRGIGRSRFSLLNYLPPTEAAVRLIVGLELVGIIGLLVGLLVSLSAALVYLTLTSLHHRNPFVLHSGDTLLRLLCLLLAFSPAGAMFSVDALLGGITTDASPWAVRLMQLLMASVYLHSAAWKLRGTWWRDGTAVYWALSADAYRRHAVPAPLRQAWVYRAATYGTLLVEAALCTLVWVAELRYVVLAAGALFHLALEYFMRIRLFQWTMLVGLLIFIRPSDLLALLRLLGIPVE